MVTKAYKQYKLNINIPENDPNKNKNFKIHKGEKVFYIGRHINGPESGSIGIVKNTLNNLAVIDLGIYGTWKIPYYYLQSLKN